MANDASTCIVSETPADLIGWHTHPTTFVPTDFYWHAQINRMGSSQTTPFVPQGVPPLTRFRFKLQQPQRETPRKKRIIRDQIYTRDVSLPAVVVRRRLFRRGGRLAAIPGIGIAGHRRRWGAAG